jgi:hypothetical protein
MEKGRTLRRDDLTATPGGPASFSYMPVIAYIICHEVRCTDPPMQRSAGDLFRHSPILGTGLGNTAPFYSLRDRKVT